MFCSYSDLKITAEGSKSALTAIEQLEFLEHTTFSVTRFYVF